MAKLVAFEETRRVALEALHEMELMLQAEDASKLEVRIDYSAAGISVSVGRTMPFMDEVLLGFRSNP
jgi:hypothetical protein